MASKYLQKYPVPQGFPDILHDFAREVLRDQPENIKEYGWLYFKALEQVSRIIYGKLNELRNVWVLMNEFILLCLYKYFER